MTLNTLYSPSLFEGLRPVRSLYCSVPTSSCSSSLSLLLGLPAVNRFLEKYAFHTDMSVWVFVSIVAAMAGITFITVGYQSARAAFTNP